MTTRLKLRPKSPETHWTRMPMRVPQSVKVPLHVPVCYCATNKRSEIYTCTNNMLFDYKMFFTPPQTCQIVNFLFATLIKGTSSRHRFDVFTSNRCRYEVDVFPMKVIAKFLIDNY